MPWNWAWPSCTAVSVDRNSCSAGLRRLERGLLVGEQGVAAGRRDDDGAAGSSPSGGRFTNVTSVCQWMPRSPGGDVAVGGVQLAAGRVVDLEHLGVALDAGDDRVALGGLAEAARRRRGARRASRCWPGKNTTLRSSHTRRIAATVASSRSRTSTPRISAPIVPDSGRDVEVGVPTAARWGGSGRSWVRVSGHGWRSGSVVVRVGSVGRVRSASVSVRRGVVSSTPSSASRRERRARKRRSPRSRGCGTSTGTSREIDAVGQHEHPVGEQDRLVDVVGDEQDRRAVAGAQLLDAGRASGSGSARRGRRTARRAAAARARARAPGPARPAGPRRPRASWASRPRGRPGRPRRAPARPRRVGVAAGRGRARRCRARGPRQQPGVLEHDRPPLGHEDVALGAARRARRGPAGACSCPSRCGRAGRRTRRRGCRGRCRASTVAVAEGPADAAVVDGERPSTGDVGVGSSRGRPCGHRPGLPARAASARGPGRRRRTAGRARRR